ncbi:hypothetical protein Hypma_011688 [Hypsizygus marmoreus]|uniref:CRA domain-containing protein n=1 Tax=Hypsizygus marmoreus TaxID=39966 RepID=A0A369JIW8_HYPMA|nr:hypothetical protein Hypma_011688 [Hypsizygus marmoreus]
MESLYTLQRGSSGSTSSNLTPVQLRALVLGYLYHECYSKTAKAFSKDSTVRHLDADGDEIQADNAASTGYELSEEDWKQLELRQKIRTYILSGQVDEATEKLNEYFPSVLSGPLSELSTPMPSYKPEIMDGIEYVSSTSVDPAHLTLNLRILSFIEACRTIPLAYPPPAPDDTEATPTPKSENLSIDDGSPASLEKQLALLSKAQKLRGLANMLPKPGDRELYIKELNNVSGLLAYKVPETSSISKYLSQKRRESVADQINRAILDRSGLPSASLLELLTRYTSTTWSFAHQLGVKPKPGALLPPTEFTQKEQEVVPPLNLQHFLDSRT